jgi:hypothetical protein
MLDNTTGPHFTDPFQERPFVPWSAPDIYLRGLQLIIANPQRRRWTAGEPYWEDKQRRSPNQSGQLDSKGRLLAERDFAVSDFSAAVVGTSPLWGG